MPSTTHPHQGPEPPAKRRRCICGCRRLFTPAKPWQKFYEDHCRKNYHRYGAAFGRLRSDGLRRLVKEARASIRGEFRAILAKAIEDVMEKAGWTDARTKSPEVSPLALKGSIDTHAALLRELRADHGRLEARIQKLESLARQQRALAQAATPVDFPDYPRLPRSGADGLVSAIGRIGPCNICRRPDCTTPNEKH